MCSVAKTLDGMFAKLTGSSLDGISIRSRAKCERTWLQFPSSNKFHLLPSEPPSAFDHPIIMLRFPWSVCLFAMNIARHVMGQAAQTPGPASERTLSLGIVSYVFEKMTKVCVAKIQT